MNKENLTVGEFIEELKKLDPKAPILFSGSGAYYSEDPTKDSVLSHYEYTSIDSYGTKGYEFTM